jgi:dTDP-glucose pyrophosphorylase
MLWRRAIVGPDATIEDAIDNLNRASLKIVLVVNDAGVLEGTISDGDIRRGLLKGLTLNSSIKQIVHRDALVVPPYMDKKLVSQLMIANKIQQIPVVDEDQKVVGLHLWDVITVPSPRSNVMVIMAGGRGTRLRPYTETCPKPMLPIAGKPMLEHIIERAKADGFNRFVLAVHYLGDMIKNHFGDGSAFDVEINYLNENTPLGTAGALTLLNPIPAEPFVVTNGDVITDISYADVLNFHQRHQAEATMAVRAHEWQHPFGVVEINGIQIVGFEEKPVMRSYINAGVYVLNPTALAHMTPGTPCDMPALFEKIQITNKLTAAYPMYEPWLDVGRPGDLTLATTEAMQKANLPNS